VLASIALPALLLYAHALQAFNPGLDDASAAALARATIESADANAIDARLLVAVIAVESRWNPAARSAAGAEGLGQLMPATAGELGVDARDPLQNIAGVARKLRTLLHRYADPATALAAYNAGEGAVARYGGVPPYPETRAYVARVLQLWDRLCRRATESPACCDTTFPGPRGRSRVRRD
jgi:soluble lytic murein transglycosylase-like protein